MIKYIPELDLKLRHCSKLPRKEKKEWIKKYGREEYYRLVREDLYIDNGWYKICFPEEWEKEMIERKNKLREIKLKRLINE